MKEVNKRLVPAYVKPRKGLGFGRPGTDIVNCSYDARVYESEKKGIGAIVFFDITTNEGSFAWGINAADLMGLDNHPVDGDRMVQTEGWIITLPSDPGHEPSFSKAG